MSQLKIFVTGDNCCLAHDFIGHSGQSLLIQYNNNNYLFDTGEFEYALTNNLSQFGTDYDQIKDIIVSHAHFDHTVGLLNVVEKLQSQRIIIPERLFSEKLMEKQLQDTTSSLI